MIKYTYVGKWNVRAFEVPTESHSKAYTELYNRLLVTKGMFDTPQEVIEYTKRLKRANRSEKEKLDKVFEQPLLKDDGRWNHHADLF